MRKKIFFAVCSAALVVMCCGPVRAELEPQLVDYTNYPVFQSASVLPNILIVLDSSGSMTDHAYLTDPYKGDEYCTFEKRVETGNDDSEERLRDNKILYCINSGTGLGLDARTSADLDLVTDEEQVWASGGPAPGPQVAKSGAENAPAEPACTIAAAAARQGMQMAGAFNARTMSDAGSLPRAGGFSQPATLKDPKGKGLELEPYGLDSGQADGVVVDQWYLSREKAGKPFMVAASNPSHTCGHSSSSTDCSCMSHNCSGSGSGANKGHSIAADCTNYTQHCVTTSSTSSSTTTTINYCANTEKQEVGIRFAGITIPRMYQGTRRVVVTKAYITFTASASSSAATNLYIDGEAADNAAGFTTADADISSTTGRPRTSLAHRVSWLNVPSWTKDREYSTPDLSTIVQEIFDRAGTGPGTGWEEGNAMVFKITGTDGSNRRAYSYDGSADKAPLLHIEYGPCDKNFYGIFNTEKRYVYVDNATNHAKGYFKITSLTDSTTWNGNFLNYITMCKFDILKKVLIGGRFASRASTGTDTLVAEPSGTSFNNTYTGAGVSSCSATAAITYTVQSGVLTTSSACNGLSSFRIKVLKEESVEPEEFCSDRNICGILQKVGTQARWGNAWFNNNSTSGQDGCTITNPIGSSFETVLTNLRDKSAANNTPLAESFYVALQYFRQVAWPTTGLPTPSGYPTTCLPSAFGVSSASDPFYKDSQRIACSKSFLLLLTDGEPTSDTNIPTWLQSYDGDTNASTNSISDYLDDLALYGHTVDLRPEMKGTQTLDSYFVYAFGTNAAARVLLKEAAINGGFIDRNGNNRPDGYNNNGGFLERPDAERVEWDLNADGIPDNYFEANNGATLKKQLLAAINSILNKAASGTAVSVLATTGEGEGTLVQAIFRPSKLSGLLEARWIGFLQSLWVDLKGNIREDSTNDRILNVAQDKVLSFYFDNDTGETKVRRYDVSAASPYPNLSTDTTFDNITLEQIVPIWEGGARLADRTPDSRHIYTYVGPNAPISTPLAFGSGNCKEFTTTNASDIEPHLGIEKAFDYDYLSSISAALRANNLIQYIRGVDGAGLTSVDLARVRNRIVEGKVWKLGDIIFSTPVSVSRPVEKYGLIYGDLSYRQYMNYYADNASTARETMVYVGGNDGMLHAFTSGYFDKSTNGFVQRGGTERVGDELWAYIPRSLLPHLKWLPNTEYTHVNYVDLKPKVLDAKVFSPDSVHTNGWGTILVCGMNFGGKHIWANNSLGVKLADYYPSYFAIDITDPRHQKLMWDRSFTNLGLTINQPAVVKVREKWYLAIGSGPSDFDALTGTFSINTSGRMYMIDLLTGAEVTHFETLETKAYFTSPLAVDKDLKWRVDVVYAGVNYMRDNATSTTTPKKQFLAGKIYRAGGPFLPAETAPYPEVWTMKTLLEDYTLAPISAQFVTSVDAKYNSWVYFGTGRFILGTDKTSSVQNYLVGLKDPFYNRLGLSTSDAAAGAPCYHNAPELACSLTLADLFDAKPYVIKPDGVVAPQIGGDPDLITWDLLIAKIRSQQTIAPFCEIYKGWYRKLDVFYDSSIPPKVLPSERVVNRPTIVRGNVVFPTYLPNQDTCGFGGDSYAYALYYETGTPFKRATIYKANGVLVDNSQVLQYKVDLGFGLSSSFGVHTGQETEGHSTLYGQMSTGLINQIELIGAISGTSGVGYWKEGR